MSLNEDFETIIKYSHFWNWAPDLQLLKKIYLKFDNSFSILTPFLYSYLEELVRTLTSDYGRYLADENGNSMKHLVGYKLIELAIIENIENTRLISILEQTKKYFNSSSAYDEGNNRNSVQHGYMHSRYWSKESFEELIHNIAILSEFSRF